MSHLNIISHGAVDGVTGSCHQLTLNDDEAILIDCGLFQGAEVSGSGTGVNHLEIEFPIESIRALVVTHCHIDHVGRIPYLMAAGFSGPIYCTQPTAVLLPLVLEDAVKIGFTKNARMVEQFLKVLAQRIVPVPYGKWQSIQLQNDDLLKVKFKPAGHILGSAYVECAVRQGSDKTRLTFSGDLGGPYTSLLPSPKSPYRSDILVLESTYGDKNHQHRRERVQALKKLVLQCFSNKGVILIPAFSIGRTQELLYELEQLIHQFRGQRLYRHLNWNDLEVIVDSPLASRFTSVYRDLKPFWDAEAQLKVRNGRHPLSFEQLTTIDSHKMHLAMVEYLQKTARPCIVLAASGMCAGGRIVNYLKALISDARTDVLFVGYQAAGTAGRSIQKYAASHGYVELDGERYTINAGVHTLEGYSAHADQATLTRFVSRMRIKPNEIRLVHGDAATKQTLRKHLQQCFPKIRVV